METSIQKWGNSQGIRIPKYIVETLQWSENEKVSIKTADNKIIIERVDGRKSIKELFENYQLDCPPIEYDWGKPVGKEIW